MFKGTTPDITMTFPDGSVDFTSAEEIIVTIKDRRGNLLLEVTPAATERVLTIYLTQEQTLALPVGAINIQANWTYQEADTLKRACSQIYTIDVIANLHNEVMS